MSSFTSFQSLLKDVFTATVRNEDEFSYTSATLAVACIYQLYARAPNYVLHQQRVASFETSLASGNSINGSTAAVSWSLSSASEFASAGFFHTGRGDETVCGTCGLGLRDWRPTDQVDVAHATFAKERAEGCSLPCLFLEVHRFLTSDLSLVRKNLFDATSATNRGFGVRWEPEASNYAINLAERLRAIALMMAPSSHRANSNWPVQNARELGYPDDLIALALWRLQSDAAPAPTSLIPLTAMTIKPQCTTLLLKSILRLQECGLGDDESDFSSGETETHSSPLTTHSNSAVGEDEGIEEDETSSSSVSDDVELHALSRREAATGIELAEPQSPSLMKTRLPPLASILLWWFSRYPQLPTELYSETTLAVSARKKANSTSI